MTSVPNQSYHAVVNDALYSRSSEDSELQPRVWGIDDLADSLAIILSPQHETMNASDFKEGIEIVESTHLVMGHNLLLGRNLTPLDLLSQLLSLKCTSSNLKLITWDRTGIDVSARGVPEC